MTRVRHILFSLLVVVLLSSAPALAQVNTTTPTQTPSEEEERTVTAIDGSTRIVEYEFNNGVLTVQIESDVPRSGTAMQLIGNTGTGVSQLEFKRITLARGLNEIKIDTGSVNGQKGAVISVGNSAVVVSESSGVNIFNERADWTGVRVAFLAGIITSLGLVGIVGYRRKTTDNLEVERVV